MNKKICVMLISVMALSNTCLSVGEETAVVSASGYVNGVYAPITPISPLGNQMMNNGIYDPNAQYQFNDKILEEALLREFKKKQSGERSLFDRRYNLYGSVTIGDYSIPEDRMYLTYEDLMHITRLSVKGGIYPRDFSTINIYGEIDTLKANRMKDIGNFKNLEYLSFGNETFSNSADLTSSINHYDINDIKGLNKLKHLEIDTAASKSEFDFTALKNMKNLEVLQVLSSGEFKNIEILTSLTNLKALSLRNWNKKDVKPEDDPGANALLAGLKELPKLESVHLEMQNINPDKLELVSAQKITKFRIESRSKASRVKLLSEINKLSELKILDINLLSDGSAASHALENALMKNLPESITSFSMKDITDTDALSSLKNVEEVYISTTKNAYVPVSLPKLRRLTITMSDKNDGTLSIDAEFFKKVPLLEQLDITQSINDYRMDKVEGITGLENVPNLTHLHIRGGLRNIKELSGWEATKLYSLNIDYIAPENIDYFLSTRDALSKTGRNIKVDYGNLHNLNIAMLANIKVLPAHIYLQNVTQAEIDKLGDVMIDKGCDNVTCVYISNSPLVEDLSPLNPWFDNLHKSKNYLQNNFGLVNCTGIKNFGNIHNVLNNAGKINFNNTPFGENEEIANKKWNDIVKKMAPQFINPITNEWIKPEPYKTIEPLGLYNTSILLKNTKITSTVPWNRFFSPMYLEMTDVTEAGVDENGRTTLKKGSYISATGKKLTYVPKDSVFDWRNFSSGKVIYQGKHYADNLSWKVPEANKMFAFKINESNESCYSINGDMLSIDRIPKDLDLKFKIITRPADYDERSYSSEKSSGAMITAEEITVDTIEILKKLYNPQSAAKTVTVERTDVPDLSDCINDPYVGTKIDVKSVPSTDELGVVTGSIDVVLRDGTRYRDIKIPVKVVEKIHTVTFVFKSEDGALIATNTLNAKHFSNIDENMIKALVPKNYVPKAIINPENNITSSYTKNIMVELAQSYTFKPKVVPEYIKKGESYDLADNIINLPNGATCKMTKGINNEEAGIHIATLTISFSDRSVLDVLVPVVVANFKAETFKPIIANEVLEQNDDIDVTDNILNLPDDASIETIKVPKTDKLGNYIAIVRVTFSDSSSKEYEVPIIIVAKKYVLKIKFIDEQAHVTAVSVNKASGEDLSAEEIKTFMPNEYLPKQDITGLKNINSDIVIEVSVVHKESFLFAPDIVGIQVPIGSIVNLLNGIKNVPADALATPLDDIDTKLPGAFIGRLKIEFKDGSSKIYNIPVSVSAYHGGGSNLEALVQALKEKEKKLAEQEKDLHKREQILTRILSKHNFDVAIFESLGDPNDPVAMVKNTQRGQVAKLIYMTLDDDIRDKYKGRKISYKDVNNEVQDVVTNIGVFEGYPDGTFRPEAMITRAEYSAVIARCMLNQTLRFDRKKFKDMERNWARDTVETLGGAGIITGYPDGTFRPGKNITNKEVILMMKRLVERAES